MLRGSRGDRNKCHGTTTGWNTIVQDFRGNVALFDSPGAHATTKVFFKLLNNVFSDFTDRKQIVLLSVK